MLAIIRVEVSGFSFIKRYARSSFSESCAWTVFLALSVPEVASHAPVLLRIVAFSIKATSLYSGAGSPAFSISLYIRSTGEPSADRDQFNNEMHGRLLKTIKINKNKLGLALLKISLYDVKSNKTARKA